MTDWQARAKALSEADGEQWDSLHEALERDWKAAYRTCFCRYAEERGWTPRHALEWAVEIEDEAFLDAYVTDYDPEKAARASVLECEMTAEEC